MRRIHPALAKLRKIVAAWPETNERLSHGAPTFWGGKKTFANFHVDHHGDGRVAIWCKASFEQQARGEPLVAADTASARPGDRVFFVRSREAAKAFPGKFAPVDAAILGIVDGVELDSPEDPE